MPYHYVKRAALKRYLQLALRLGTPSFWCHQTLTFSPKVYTYPEVKSALNPFLDRLMKRFPDMFVLYVVEADDNLGLHVHAHLCFYDETSPSYPKCLQKFGAEVFKVWNRINGRRLARVANKTTRPEKIDPTYAIKNVRILPETRSKERSKANWWGCRNKSVLRKNGIPDNPKEVLKILGNYEASRGPVPNRQQREAPAKDQPSQPATGLRFDQEALPAISGNSPTSKQPATGKIPSDLEKILMAITCVHT